MTFTEGNSLEGTIKIFKTTLWVKFNYYSLFTDEETEVREVTEIAQDQPKKIIIIDIGVGPCSLDPEITLSHLPILSTMPAWKVLCKVCLKIKYNAAHKIIITKPVT